MPKPSEPAPRRKVQKIVKYDDSHECDVPLQLQPGSQAYIGPEHMLKVPVRPMDDRLVEISHCLSNHRACRSSAGSPQHSSMMMGRRIVPASSATSRMKWPICRSSRCCCASATMMTGGSSFVFACLAEWKVLPGKVCRGSRLRSRLCNLTSTNWTGVTILASTRTPRPRTPIHHLSEDRVPFHGFPRMQRHYQKRTCRWRLSPKDGAWA